MWIYNRFKVNSTYQKGCVRNMLKVSMKTLGINDIVTNDIFLVIVSYIVLIKRNIYCLLIKANILTL